MRGYQGMRPVMEAEEKSDSPVRMTSHDTTMDDHRSEQNHSNSPPSRMVDRQSHTSLSSLFSWTSLPSLHGSTGSIDEEEEDDDGFMFLPLSRQGEMVNPLFSSTAYPHIYSIFESLLQNQIDQLIMDDVTSESLSNYTEELLRRDDTVTLACEKAEEKYSIQNARNTKCFICMEDFHEDENVQCIPCAHTFHKECIENAIKYSTKCPLCRAEIPTTISTTDSEQLDDLVNLGAT